MGGASSAPTKTAIEKVLSTRVTITSDGYQEPSRTDPFGEYDADPVDLAASRSKPSGELDVLIDIESLTGSDHDGSLTGDAGANVIDGGLGDDMLTGGAGDDRFVASIDGDTILDFAPGDPIDLAAHWRASRSTRSPLLKKTYCCEARR